MRQSHINVLVQQTFTATDLIAPVHLIICSILFNGHKSRQP